MTQCYLCNEQLSLQRFEQLDGESRPICGRCFYKLYMISFSHDCYIRYSPESNSIRVHNVSNSFFDLDLFSYNDLKKSQKYRLNKIKFDATYLYAFRIGV